MDFKDYYATLGVPKTASEKEIKQAFRRLARKLHPDVNPGDKAAEARFKDINEANEVPGQPRDAQEVRRAGLQLADVRAGAGARRARSVRGAAAPGGRRVPDDVRRRRWTEMFGDSHPVLGLLHHVLRRRRRAAHEPSGRAGARDATSSTRSS